MLDAAKSTSVPCHQEPISGTIYVPLSIGLLHFRSPNRLNSSNRPALHPGSVQHRATPSHIMFYSQHQFSKNPYFTPTLSRSFFVNLVFVQNRKGSIPMCKIMRFLFTKSGPIRFVLNKTKDRDKTFSR